MRVLFEFYALFYVLDPDGHGTKWLQWLGRRDGSPFG